MLHQILTPTNIHAPLIEFVQQIMDGTPLKYRVCARVPNPRPEKLVQITHMNSQDIPPVQCSNSFMIAVQSRDRVECMDVANLLCAVMGNMSKSRLGDHYIHCSEVINHPYFLDNPELDQVQQYIFGIRYIMPMKIS